MIFIQYLQSCDATYAITSNSRYLEQWPAGMEVNAQVEPVGCIDIFTSWYKLLFIDISFHRIMQWRLHELLLPQQRW